MHRSILFIVYSIKNNLVTSLGLVSPCVATEGVTPIFSWKKLTTCFFVITVCQFFCSVTPIYFLLKNRRPFFAHHCHFFYFTRVSPPWRVSPHTFFLSDADLVCPLFIVNSPTKILFGCHPPAGVTRGSPPPVSYTHLTLPTIYSV